MQLPELQKGDTLTIDATQKLIPHKQGTSKYAFALLQLRNEIERTFAAKGEPVTVVVRDNLLHICTDAEASAYNAHAVARHAHGTLKRARKLHEVPVIALTAEERRAHERRLAYASIIADGIRSNMRIGSEVIDA